MNRKESTEWFSCDGYELIVHNAGQATPHTQFDFTAHGADGKIYAVTLAESDDAGLLSQILRVIANRWPERPVEVKATPDRVVTEIRSPRSG